MFHWESMHKNVVDQLGLLLSTWSFSSSNPISKRATKCKLEKGWPWEGVQNMGKLFLLKHFQAFRWQRSHWCQTCLLKNVSHKFSLCFSGWWFALSSQRVPSKVHFPHFSSSLWLLFEVYFRLELQRPSWSGAPLLSAMAISSSARCNRSFCCSAGLPKYKSWIKVTSEVVPIDLIIHLCFQDFFFFKNKSTLQTLV